MITNTDIDNVMLISHPAGSNYPSGFRQGEFYLPEAPSQGLPVGFTQPVCMTNIVGANDDGTTPISQLTIPESDGDFVAYFPLGAFVVNQTGWTLVTPDNGMPYIELHTPRALDIIITGADGIIASIEVSFEDNYGKKGVFTQNYGSTPFRAVKRIFSVLFTGQEAASAGVAFLEISDFIELPFTDYGTGSAGTCNMFLVAATNPDPVQNSINLISVQDSEPFTYQYNFTSYVPASWSTALTVGSGNPRPLVEAPWDNTSIFFFQISFGLENSEYIDNFIDPIAPDYAGSENEDVYRVYGLPQYLDDSWTGWQG